MKPIKKYIHIISLCLIATTFPLAAKNTALKLMSKHNAKVELIVSDENSKVMEEDVWGVKLNFIINRSAFDVYQALKQVNLYPKYIKKIEASKVLFNDQQKIIIKYTASSWGLSITSIQEWEFKKNNLFMRTIGENDNKIYLHIQIHQLDEPAYSKIYMTGYLQIPWVPNFMMDMSESFIESHAAQETRKLVNDISPRKRSMIEILRDGN